MSADRPAGFLVAFEGGEGAGKSTQVRSLAKWVAAQGRAVRTTFEPGDTPAGAVVRGLLLDRSGLALAPRAEALLFAADRAQHVAAVLRPALAAGEVVITDRYVDSSLAYQGAGRDLDREEVAELSRWATDGLVPDLTVLLDLPPTEGLARARGRAAADRMEAESLDFHERVRRGFLDLAAADPVRYLVLDATRPADEVAGRVRERVAGLVS